MSTTITAEISDSLNEWRVKYNTLAETIGDYSMGSPARTFSEIITEIDSAVGTISDLETVENTSIVGAINELNDSIGFSDVRNSSGVSQFVSGQGAQNIQFAGINGVGVAFDAGNKRVTFSHTDTSSQASINNSNGTVIQDVTIDTYGHITALGSVNLDSRYFTETESDARFLGISAKAADSDKLDNLDSTQFLRSDTSDVKTSGTLRFSDNVSCAFGAGDDASYYCDGAAFYLNIATTISNFNIEQIKYGPVYHHSGE